MEEWIWFNIACFYAYENFKLCLTIFQKVEIVRNYLVKIFKASFTLSDENKL